MMQLPEKPTVAVMILASVILASVMLDSCQAQTDAQNPDIAGTETGIISRSRIRLYGRENGPLKS